MDPNRSRYKQVGAKFRGADDSRAARAIATKDGQRNRRSTALHVRRNIPDDLTPVVSPEPVATAAPQARLPATAALANVRAKIARLVSQKTVACSTFSNVQQDVLTVAEENATSFIKKQETKSIEQLTKERMEALKIYKQRKQKQLEREKKTRKPNFWIGVAKREPKVLLLPTVAESNSSKLETPGCTPSKQSLPVWHTGFSSISKKSAPLPSTMTSRNSRCSSRNLFSSALKGSLGQAAEPRLQRQRSRGNVAPPSDVDVQHRGAEEDFRMADPDSFAPSGYTFTAPDGLEQPRLVSAAVSPRRPSTIRFSKVPALPATPSERVPKRMPTSKTPKPGAPRAQSRSSSTVSSNCTSATSPCSSQGVQSIRSSSVRSRKESSDCDTQPSIQSSTRESYLDESQHSYVSPSCVRSTRASKTSTSSFTPSGGDGSGAASNSSVLSASKRRSAHTSNRDSLGIEILEASPPTVARFKRRNPIHQLLPILGDLPTEVVSASVRADCDSHEVEKGEYFDASEVQLNNDTQNLLQKPHLSIEDDKESLPEDCSFPDVFQELSSENVIPPHEQSPGLLAPNNRAMKRKRSSLVSLPPSAKKSKQVTRMNRSQTSLRDDVPLQPESNKKKVRRSNSSSAVDSFNSLAHIEPRQKNDQSSTPGLAMRESKTKTKSSPAMTPQNIHRNSPLGRTPKSSGRLSLVSDGTLSDHTANSNLTERNKSTGRDIAMKNSGSLSLNHPNLSPPYKGNDLGCSPLLQQTQARLSIPTFLDDHTAGPVASLASNSSKSAVSPSRTPVGIPVPSTYYVDDPPQTPVVATLKSGSKATSSLRKSSRQTMSSLEESSDAICVTPRQMSQRLTATTPCSRSTRRSLAVHADTTWQEYCTTPSVTTQTPGKRGRRKTVQVKLAAGEEPLHESGEVLETVASKNNVDADKGEVTKDAVVSLADAAHADTEDMTEQISSVATFKTPQSSGRGRPRRGSTPFVYNDSASRTRSSSQEKHSRKIVLAAPPLSFLSTDTSTDSDSSPDLVRSHSANRCHTNLLTPLMMLRKTQSSHLGLLPCESLCTPTSSKKVIKPPAYLLVSAKALKEMSEKRVAAVQMVYGESVCASESDSSSGTKSFRARAKGFRRHSRCSSLNDSAGRLPNSPALNFNYTDTPESCSASEASPSVDEIENIKTTWPLSKSLPYQPVPCSLLADGVSNLPSASEQCSSDEPRRGISRVSWMVRESPFINHESRSAKRRKASERASRHGISPFDLVFTAEDLPPAADCSPALPSENGGPSDGLAELLRPSTPCLDTPASPDVWAEMSTSCHTADPISDPLSITHNPEMGEEDTIGSACDTVIRVNTGNVSSEASTDVIELPDIVLSNNDQSQSDDKFDPQEEGGDGPSSNDVAALPTTNKKDTPRRSKGGRRSRQSLAVAAALESSRRVLLAAAVGQENRPPRVSFAPDAHNNRVSLGLFAPGALATPAPSGSVLPGQDLICLDSPESGLTVPTVTLGGDLISLDTPTPKGRKGLRGRSSRVSQLAALYESPSPSTPRPSSPSTPRTPSAKPGTPGTLRRSSRRSVLTPRPENIA